MPASVRRQNLTDNARAMPKVKYIASPAEVPAGHQHVLVEFGDEYRETRQPHGFTITVARQQSKVISELSFLTAVHTARGIAKKEGIPDVFACGYPRVARPG